MNSKDLTRFEKRFEEWELLHPRRWVATTDKREAASFIAKQAEKIRRTQLESADRIIVSQRYISEEVDKVAIGIDRVADGLEGLSAAFEWGFSELVWQVEQQRSLLEDILKTLQAPLDTQAKELKKRAQDAYKNGWIDDALQDFLESEKKNQYDFTIHQSLGNIYFHKKEPNKALEYYEKAVKYATPKSAYHASFALLHIGLIRRLQENFQKAYEATFNAIELLPNLYEAHYQHAKSCRYLDKYDEAIEHLRIAIEGDRYYCTKANSDKDFIAVNQQLQLLFKDLQSETYDLAKSEVKKAQEFILKAESDWLSACRLIEPVIDPINLAKKKLSKAKNLLEGKSLFECWDALYKAYAVQELTLDSASKQVSVAIKQAKNSRKKGDSIFRNKRKEKAKDYGSVIAILSYSVILAAYIWGAVLVESITGGVVFGILGFIALVIFWFVAPYAAIVRDTIISWCLYPKYKKELYEWNKKAKKQLENCKRELPQIKAKQAQVETKITNQISSKIQDVTDEKLITIYHSLQN